jgi:hypothetical protein
MDEPSCKTTSSCCPSIGSISPLIRTLHHCYHLFVAGTVGLISRNGYLDAFANGKSQYRLFKAGDHIAAANGELKRLTAAVAAGAATAGTAAIAQPQLSCSAVSEESKILPSLRVPV